MQVPVAFVILFILRYKIHFVHFLRLLQHRYYWCRLCCSYACIFFLLLLSLSFRLSLIFGVETAVFFMAHVCHQPR